MRISLLDLLDKKKSRPNLTFAFAVNLAKTLFYFFHVLSVSYSVGRAFQNKIVGLFFSANDPRLVFEVFLFSFSTGNNSFNVHNGSLVFIDKNGSQTHQSHKHSLHQLLSKAPSEFQDRKHVLRAAKLEAIYFVRSEFLKIFNCDLVRVI